MAQTKRAWKLQEFIAHGSNVNCLALGHKSGRVLATGGEDRKVNVWAVDKPNCILSLQGHTTPVESVRFDNAEELLVAGSMSGALKIWNLEEAKIVRTLTGHKAGIRSLDFHPYGGYAASGSLDSNIKLWDIRRKGCIFTYKGHTNGVNCLRFSPDGRWIASAGEDSLIKIWDLRSGKLLADLKEHNGPVNVVEFHPNEVLLASGGDDRIIRFWDLETCQLVCATDGDSTPVRRVMYHPDGLCLYSGGNSLLKVYGWEPARTFDSIPLGWNDVADITIAQTQLIGASFSKTNVCTYVVDIQRVQPVGGIAYQEATVSPSPQKPEPRGEKAETRQQPVKSTNRRSFVMERPPTQSSRQKNIPQNIKPEPSEPDDPSEDAKSSVDIKNMREFQEHFQNSLKIAQSPDLPPSKMEPFSPPHDDDYPEKEPVKQGKQLPRTPPAQRRLAHSPPPKKQVEKLSPLPQKHAVNSPRQSPPPPHPHVEAQPQPTAVQRQAPVVAPQERRQPAHVPPPERRKPTTPRENNKPSSIAAEDFLPKSVLAAGGDIIPSNSEDNVLCGLQKGHKAMSTVLANRGHNIQIVRAMWTAGNTKTAVDEAIRMGDQAVVVDVLGVLRHKPSLWTLDLCSILLPQLKELFGSKYESYVKTCCYSLKVILENLGPVIKGNMTSAPSIGVDISREERHRKCSACYTDLMYIQALMEKKQNSIQGELRNTFREIHILMKLLD